MSSQVDFKDESEHDSSDQFVVENNSSSLMNSPSCGVNRLCENEEPASVNSNKKRKLESDSSDQVSAHKRSNSNGCSSSNSSSISCEMEVYFKLLIPSSAAGGVIGRGGEKIAQIQKDANVKMKMSKANDYYPNTNERVCLIIGTIRSIIKAHDFIVERMQEKPDTINVQNMKHSHSNTNDQVEDRANQIKILIPNSTAGLLIGKNGVYIKQIKDESDAFVQISSKQTDLPERIVTIEGEKSKRDKALLLVIRKIAQDPQHSTVTNLNYSMRGSGGVGSGIGEFPHGGGFNGCSSLNTNIGINGPIGHNKFDFNSAANYLAGLNNLALLIINCGGSFQMSAESLKLTLRNAGYNSSASIEIIDAITILMNYSLITKVAPNGIFPNNPPINSNHSLNNNVPMNVQHNNHHQHTQYNQYQQPYHNSSSHHHQMPHYTNSHYHHQSHHTGPSQMNGNGNNGVLHLMGKMNKK